MSQQTASPSHFDPLLDCLIILTQLHGRSYSRQALTAGLPLLANRLTPSLFIRAGQRAGLSSRILTRPLNKISSMVLPVVLLLNEGNACLLTKIDEETMQCEVIFPEAGSGSAQVTLAKLAESYSGYAIFVKPTPKFEKRADEQRLEKPTSWFWGTFLRYKQDYIQIVLASLVTNLFAIAGSLFTMNVYDRVVPNNAFETLWALAIGIMVVYIFDLVLKMLRGYLIDISGKKADTVLAGLIFQQSLGLRMDVKPVSAGGFFNNLNGYESIRDFFTSATLVGLVDLPFLFLFIWLTWVIGGAIVLIPLLAIPLIVGSAYLLEIPMRKATETGYLGSTQKQALLVEAISGLETIKSLCAESQVQRKWETYVSVMARAGLTSRFYSSLIINLAMYLIQMVNVATIIAGVYLISKGELSMGGLIACTILSGRALAPLTQIAGIISRYQQTKLGLQSLNNIMGLPVERSEKSVFLHRPEIKGKIEFINVSFTYPRQKMGALKGVSFNIEAGERVGIIGRVGSGKSTSQKLILSLYNIQEGSIRIDGTDLAQIDPADLRRNIGYVGQDNLLFYGSVRDNITYGTPWADDVTILQAAKLAGVDNFVRLHPEGYDMLVGERGEALSGGQRQAIAIARALLTNPPILMMDEPTSAMDSTSEREFIHMMQSYSRNKTLILATHKRTLLELVDRIIIMDGGKIIADGPREKVLEALNTNAIKTTAE